MSENTINTVGMLHVENASPSQELEYDVRRNVDFGVAVQDQGAPYLEWDDVNNGFAFTDMTTVVDPYFSTTGTVEVVSDVTNVATGVGLVVETQVTDVDPWVEIWRGTTTLVTGTDGLPGRYSFPVNFVQSQELANLQTGSRMRIQAWKTVDTVQPVTIVKAALNIECKATDTAVTDKTVAGDIRLFPFRNGTLPFGWYICDGTQFGETTSQAMVLSAMSIDFKADWGIENVSGLVNVPDLFTGNGGSFFRPVDGVSRLPGSEQKGSYLTAIRSNLSTRIVCPRANLNVSGSDAPESLGMDSTSGYSYPSVGYSKIYGSSSGAGHTVGVSRPHNVGFTPAIYLGM